MTEPLGPDSLTWQLGFPRTGLLVAGRALFLQVAHPTIGAGVRDFSQFRTAPWSRLENTLESLQVQLFGGAEAKAEADRLRQLHRSIRGTGFDGRPYSALEAEAYAWVHLSNAETSLLFNDMFALPLTPAQKEQLYREWRQVGLVLGIPDREMPPDLAGLRAYVDDKIANRLQVNDTCRELLDSLSLRDVPPPYKLFPKPLWAVVRPFGRTLLHLTTVGTLPQSLRDQLGTPWTSRDEQRLRALAAAVRAATPLVPDRALHFAAGYRATRDARRYAKTA